MLKLVAGVLLALIGAIGTVLLAQRSVIFGLYEGGGLDWMRIGFGYLATVAGVILGSVYRQLRQLQDRRVQKVPKGFLGNCLRSIDLWMGLCASPIVFALLMQASAGMNLPGIAIVALENGFCCLLIVNGFVTKTQAANAPSAAPVSP